MPVIIHVENVVIEGLENTTFLPSVNSCSSGKGRFTMSTDSTLPLDRQHRRNTPRAYFIRVIVGLCVFKVKIICLARIWVLGQITLVKRRFTTVAC